MRRPALLAILLLSGCSGSGFWRYQQDTYTFPWSNPNGPASGSSNFARSEHGMKTGGSAEMLTEAGDIWPGPPAPVPTLKQLQKQQMGEIDVNGAGAGDATAALAPLPALPSLPGYTISTQDPVRPAPSSLFSNGEVAIPGGRHASTNYHGAPTSLPVGGTPQTQTNGDIVVPNGNGTSTVISPTGQVSTVPTPGK